MPSKAKAVIPVDTTPLAELWRLLVEKLTVPCELCSGKGTASGMVDYDSSRNVFCEDCNGSGKVYPLREKCPCIRIDSCRACRGGHSPNCIRLGCSFGTVSIEPSMERLLEALREYGLRHGEWAVSLDGQVVIRLRRPHFRERERGVGQSYLLALCRAAAKAVLE